MSNFVVSARKYRPNRFDDVVGQGHVSGTLKNALQNNHLAHAFLFTGPRGVGKTTCARILAKVLNCQNVGEDHEPCNTCASCEAFNGNASFNITELDAASNNSVEHIRALIEQVRFQPQQGKYKVFIIDEVHMLSQQAFNAFLKTLEEPPSYAIFILATTEKHKIIPTILSRCQIFDFRRIQVNDIVDYLQEICKKEEIKADKNALHIIAQKADGALRDALSIFDRIVSFSGKIIKYEDVITNLNVLDYDYYFQIIDALMTSDIHKSLLIFDDILKKGFDADIFINGLAEHLRNLLVCSDEKTLALLEVSDSLKERYEQQSNLTPSSFLLTALNIANDCDVNYKMARNKRLHTEMAIIKMAHIGQAVELSQQSVAASAPIAEKKKPDLTTSPLIVKKEPAPPVVLNEPKVEEEAAKEEPTAPLPAEQVQSNSKQEATTDPPAQKEESGTANKMSLKNRLKKSDKKLTPTLSLDAIQQSVIEENEKDQSERKEVLLTLENLQKAWDEYVATVSSKSVMMTLKNTELKLEGKVLTVIVGSRLAEGHLKEEFDLMDHLRKELQTTNLTREIIIDESRALSNNIPQKEKPLTPKEKFDDMKTQNPLVADLYKRFDLKLDGE